MNVLFVTNGNSPIYEIVPFVKSQGDSLEKKGVNLKYYLIRGKGIRGYLGNIRSLKQLLKKADLDVIHAHYSLTALTVLLACPHVPIVASYMGSDVYGSYSSRKRFRVTDWWMTIIAVLIQPFLSYIICKSPNIKKYVFKRRTSIIPNGVDLDFFFPENSTPEETDPSRIRTVLFAGDKSMPRKNYALVEQAVELLDDPLVRIEAPFPVSQIELRTFYNQADVLVLSSLQEGSPNSIKEAMACNVPIVSTDVGDAQWLLGDVLGHYIADFDPKDFAKKIRNALDFGTRTRGRERLISLGLDSETVAKKIITIYNEVISKRRK